ncbi:L-aspartate oxidase [Metabacillus niabensis]|uniref:L-aspartate oxidase n=1 Tax=Metabacillus niabensis TaxID=324854 RepID=A0ABT9YXL1_9BACI|nr:L-aspartate oxidase [Metabacillus niabensis]MDQ0224728.1 L-aspartate oxidase [Metabacillus niabensis]
MPQSDIVIIGSGIAALSAAYHLKNRKVVIITKSLWADSNSMLAQGGIAAVTQKNDSWENHYRDTLIAGCFHNDEKNVEFLVKDGPKEIKDWCQKGITFDTDENGQFLLGKEGAHSQHRILHAGGDATGLKVTSFLYQAVKASVTIVENEMATDLIIKDGICCGVYTKNEKGEITQYISSKTIIASGGCGAVYGNTSNAEVITGDGIAMAYRAGAEIADMEFIQFHPTMLHVNGRCVGLISEAVRGEGAILVNQNGEAFMEHKHDQKDLAPRDIVARAIFDEMKKGNNVFLDISCIKNFQTRFPTISEICVRNGIDLKKGKIPVAPGMHFLMGGIRTNDKGETSINNLFAIGEAACTGVHGANRLASNSLLEGLVFAKRVADHINSKPVVNEKKVFPNIQEECCETLKISLPTKKQIQEMMNKYVGIQRTQAELNYVINWFMRYERFFQNNNVKNFTKEEIEIINLLTVGWLIATSASMRTESRGGHYRLDFPVADDNTWRKKQIIRTKQEMVVGV